ncbi:DUF3089 domain-containing protein [Nocardia sp. NPDC050712]|uniref:DUF3089 domain-containing protein n=1 Tax=Nocardia sp. NPDC050712 TaxID=3155518 RepID=UPI0033F45B15
MRERRWTRLIITALLGGGVLVAQPGAASAEPAGVEWLCEPGPADNPCAGSLATTVRRAGQPDTREEPAAKRDIDCFYVYPTVSQDLSVNAGPSATPEVQAVARQQAARFSQVCDVYAPVYRQRTLAGLLRENSNPDPQQRAETTRIAYAGVLAAWREYLTVHNRGRGVLLIGHSQGTGMLRQLLRTEVDPVPAVRARVVSAMLLGGNVAVPKNADVGGDFQHLPLCRAEQQTGCVIAWQTYGSTPPANARFGRNPAPPDAPTAPYGPDYEVACTNPASLRDNESRVARTIVRSGVAPTVVGLGAALNYNGLTAAAPTPWIVPAETYRVECVRAGDAHVLLATPEPGSRTLRDVPDATWGLHIVDLDLALGDLIRIAESQSAAYLSR